MQNKNNNKKINIFSQMEKDVLEFWDKEDIFKKSVQKEAPNGDYVFYDGPPFATGMPHYGHIVGTLMKDVVPRYWTMKGYRVERKWGWDCHGLPVENLAEKEMKLKNKTDIEKIGVEKFNGYCSSIVMRYAKEWKGIIKRIGRWVDMENDYKTMDANYTESIWWVFKTLFDKGLIYQGHKAMHICPRCGTTLSNFEVTQNYKDIKDLSVIAKFELVDEPNTFVLAWTTTPWTLIGNVALAVRDDIEYIKIKVKNNFYIIAKDIYEGLSDKNDKNPLKIAFNLVCSDAIDIYNRSNLVKKFKGKDLVNKKYKPLFDYYSKDEKLKNKENGWKIYSANFVNTDEGTGIVHIAPAFGEDDMEMGKKYNLPFVQHVDENGRFKKEVKDFKELEVKPKDNHQKTDIEIIKYLAHNNLLFSKEKYEHSYPHCWRCDTPLLNYATESWFVNVTKIKKDLIKTNTKINWVPEHIKLGRFGKWLENARDWAISRNRYWGAPLPVWICDKCGEKKVIGSRDELKGKLGSFYILRHGEALNNINKIYSAGLNDKMFLTEKGRNEIEKRAEELKKYNIDLIISSDYDRTKQTSEIIANKLGIKIIYNSKLREINVGDFQGSSMNNNLKFKEQWKNGVDISYPNGESWSDAKKRIMNFYEELYNEYSNKKVLIVSHGDILTAFQAFLSNKNYLQEIKKAYANNYIQKGEIRKIDYVIPNLHKQFVDKIELKCEKCKGKMKRIPEVLDCWFESGAMPYAQQHYPFENKEKFENNFPANFIAEGVDQTRGWFYTLHVLANALKINNKANPAFKNVIVNGIVLAEDGKKMSKRLQNYPDPSEIFQKYSVDALRYYLLSSPILLAENINFSENGVKEALRKVEMILWNVVKFYKMFANETDYNIQPKNNSNNILDKWILARLNQLIDEVTKNMDNYIIPKAIRPIEEFINDLSTWYIRRSRDRFKGNDEQDKKFALQTTKFILIELSKIMAPFLPFLAEQVWQNVNDINFKDKNKSVHLEKWPVTEKIDNKILKEMEAVRKIVELGLAKRDEVGIKVRQPLNELKIKSKKLKTEKEYDNLIKDELNIKKINLDIKISEELKIGDEIELDTKITPELKEEGTIREIIRSINNLRKQANMTIRDRAIIYWQTDNKNIENIINENKKYILKSTLSDELIKNINNNIKNIKSIKIDKKEIVIGVIKK